MAANDRFPDSGLEIDAPPDDGYSIDVSAEDRNLTGENRGISTSIWVGTGGDLEVTLKGGTKLIYKNIPDGYLLPIRAKIVHTANTTAADLIIHP